MGLGRRNTSEPDTDFGSEAIETIDMPERRRGVLVPLIIVMVLLLGGGATAIHLLGQPDGGIPKEVIRLSPPEPAPPPTKRPTGNAPASETLPVQTPENLAALALTPAPVAAVVTQSRHGPLPQIAPDGRTPMAVYARPFDMKDPRPRIALIISGLGLSRQVTDSAIETLPPQVTLSFAPYPADIQLAVAKARAAGHEVMLDVPMEPFDYPHNDPGPYTLLTRADVAENINRLEWVMSRFTGYSGILNDQGEKLLGSTQDLKPILRVVKARGLYFVDRGEARRSVSADIAREEGLAYGNSAASIDASASREGIDLKLLQLEEAARQNGSAIGLGLAYPVTVDRIVAWAANLDSKGLALAPVSAVVSAPTAPEKRKP